ncbi:MAG: efflux RND transporter permease subunit, partial [Pseudomonadota bacterium]
LWPGVPGEFMSYLPITVIFVLTASFITAMIFLPVLGMLFGGRSGPQKASSPLTDQEEDSNAQKIGGLTGAYVRALGSMIRFPVTVLAVTLVIMAGTFWTYGKYNSGAEFFVDTEPDQLFTFISARGNLSVREQGDLVRAVEAEVAKIDGIKSVYTSTGAGDSGGIVGSGVSDSPADEIGRLNIELKDFEERRPGKEIIAEIRDRTSVFPGLRVETRKREDGPPQGKGLNLEVLSDTWSDALAATTRVRQFVDGMTDIADIEDSRPLPGIEWQIKVDRKEAGRYGADVTSVGGMVQLVTNGVLVGTYRPDNSEEEVDIRVRLPATDRSIDQLDSLRVQTPQGAVPISNFVTREAQPQVNAITRQDGQFIMTVKARVDEGVLPSDKQAELLKWIGAQQWPAGVSFQLGGADQDEKDSQAFLAKAMVGALFLMFLILLTQFNSFYQAAITLSTVVLSVVGVLIGMLVTGQKFSIIMTGTAIIALAGIVVNNSIVLIDTYNRLKQLGISARDAALRACGQRLRPVLLTTITTIFGLLPMAMQVNTDFINRTVQIGSVTSIWWVQLSTAIIAGLTFATLITLVLTPALLTLPETWGRTLRWIFRRGEKTAHAAGPGRRGDTDDPQSPTDTPSAEPSDQPDRRPQPIPFPEAAE